MKKVMFLLAVGVMCLTACAQKKKGGERGPRQGGHMEINKDSDSTFVALKNETLKKFKQLTFNDTQTGKTMEYNLLIPEGAEAGQKLPLVLFMADASTVGSGLWSVGVRLRQGSERASSVRIGSPIHGMGGAGRLEHDGRGGDDHTSA